MYNILQRVFVKGVLLPFMIALFLLYCFHRCQNILFFWGYNKSRYLVKKKEKSIKYAWKHLAGKPQRIWFLNSFNCFLTHKLLFTALQRPLQRFSLSNVTHLVRSVTTAVLFLSWFSHFLSFALAFFKCGPQYQCFTIAPLCFAIWCPHSWRTTDGQMWGEVTVM